MWGEGECCVDEAEPYLLNLCCFSCYLCNHPINVYTSVIVCKCEGLNIVLFVCLLFTDNAYDPDVNAKQFWIDRTMVKGQECLTFMDNGNGLDHETMHKMLRYKYTAL